MDRFWLTEIKNRRFNTDTKMGDFIMRIKYVASSKFPLGERRAALFDAKQTTEDPFDYLDTLTQLIGSTD